MTAAQSRFTLDDVTQMQPTSSGSAPAGWYPAQGGLRYWDGARWTEHVAPPQQMPQVVVNAPQMRSMTVGGMTNGQHVFHAILTVCTLGLWAPIWALIAWSRRKRTGINY